MPPPFPQTPRRLPIVFGKAIALLATAFAVLALTSLAVVSAETQPASAVPAESFPRGSPERQGVSSAAILKFVETIEASGVEPHSFMLARHGQVVAEGWWSPFRPDLKHPVHSVAKSFLSTAVGLAIGEGRLRVDDKVASLLPDKLPATVSENLSALRVKHLLTMASGHAVNPLKEIKDSANRDWLVDILERPIPNPPGTQFLYSGGSPMILSGIIQRLTGQTVEDYLQTRLFQPLAITDFEWERNAHGVTRGGGSMSLRTEDLAKFGQLYLQGGLWKNRQLVPRVWIEEATRGYIASTYGPDRPDNSQGYGYYFWRAQHNAYWAFGANSQICLVMPDQDAVLVMTSATARTQVIFDAIWADLFPGLTPGVLPTDGANEARLRAKLKGLRLPAATGEVTSEIARSVSGKRFSLAPNPRGIDTLSFTFQRDVCVVSTHDALGEGQVTCGLGHWRDANADLASVPARLVTGVPLKLQGFSASGAWSAPDTFTMHWGIPEGGKIEIIRCVFRDDGISVAWGQNGPTLSGRAK